MRPSSLLRIALVASFVIMAVAPSASAQDKGQVGLVVGYPANVGVVWQVRERVGIRVDGSYSFSSRKSEENREPQVQTIGTTVITLGGGNSSSETHSHNGTVGVSLLLDLKRADRFAVYLAPRVSVTMLRSSTEATYVSSSFIWYDTGRRDFETEQVAYTASSRTPSFATSLGARSALNAHLTVFGEAGVSYTRTDPAVPTITATLSLAGVPTTPATTTSTAHSVVIRSGIGVIIFF